MVKWPHWRGFEAALHYYNFCILVSLNGRFTADQDPWPRLPMAMGLVMPYESLESHVAYLAAVEESKEGLAPSSSTGAVWDLVYI